MAKHGAIHGTTILAARRGGVTALGGDGQVTLADTVLKGSAVKTRRLQEGQVLAGFAGSVADAMTLFDRFEAKLGEHATLKRAAVELAKDWRTDRYLRRLEAMLVCADAEALLLVSGSGEVFEPDDDCIAVGSGGNFAIAAARALLRHGPEKMTAEEIVREALSIAAELCVYTNSNISVEVIGG